MSISEPKKGCLYCNRKAAIFEHLGSDELNQINESRYELTYNAGDHIIKQGAPASHVTFIYLNSGGTLDVTENIPTKADLKGRPFVGQLIQSESFFVPWMSINMYSLKWFMVSTSLPVKPD